jgi:WD40 repeat protein
VQAGKSDAPILAHSQAVYDVSFGTDSVIATCSADGTARIVDIRCVCVCVEPDSELCYHAFYCPALTALRFAIRGAHLVGHKESHAGIRSKVQFCTPTRGERIQSCLESCGTDWIHVTWPRLHQGRTQYSLWTLVYQALPSCTCSRTHSLSTPSLWHHILHNTSALVVTIRGL